jgi:hypothetical protein
MKKINDERGKSRNSAIGLAVMAGTFAMVANASASDWRPVSSSVTVGGHEYERVAAQNPIAIQSLASNPKLFRFTARRGEKSRSDVASNSSVDRAELSGWAQPHALGADVWISYSQRVLPGAPITSRWCVIGQMHATTQAGDIGSSPPFALHFLPGNVFQVSTRYVAAVNHVENPPETIVHSERIERNRWYNHVFRLRFGYSGDAILQWWRDGVQMLNLSGISMGYNDPKGPYWQFGVYRKTSAEELSVEYRNVEVSQASLASRISSPLSMDVRRSRNGLSTYGSKISELK